jgi:hypothetical protein
VGAADDVYEAKAGIGICDRGTAELLYDHGISSTAYPVPL